MKKLLVLLISLVLCTCFVEAQYILTPPNLSSMYYGGDSVSLVDSSIWSAITQSRFILGWQWAGPNHKTNERLHINFYQNNYGWSDPLNDFTRFPISADTSLIVWGDIKALDGSKWQVNQMGYQFDPRADTALSSTTTIRYGDTTGAIYGFTTRHSLLSFPAFGSTNFNRVLVDTNIGGTSSTGATILDKPVIANGYYQGFDTFKAVLDPDTSNHDRYTNYTRDSLTYLLKCRSVGRWWIVSINLRRTNDTDVINNSDTLVSLELPYTLRDGTLGKIVFDSVAFDSLSTHSEALPNNRGLVLKMKKAVPSQKVLYISRRMLPQGTSSPNTRDITISAFFRVKNPIEADSSNPSMSYLPSKSVTDIDTLGIRVKYHGKGAVAIDWCRIATPDCEYLIRGLYDSLIWVNTRYTLKLIKDSIAANSARKMRLLAFYGKDEATSEMFWSQRYYNYLFNNRFAIEGAGESLSRRVWNSKLPWLGGFVENWHHYSPTCFMSEGVGGGAKSSYTFTMKYGYKYSAHMGGRSVSPDGSSYETDLRVDYSNYAKIKRTDSSDVLYFKKYPIMLQMPTPDTIQYFGAVHDLESSILRGIQNTCLYDSLPWWVNIWGTAPLEITYYPTETSRVVTSSGKRVLTGEEMRAQICVPLLFGAKGLIYDRMYSDSVSLTTWTDRWGNLVYCDTCVQMYGKPHGRFQGMMLAEAQIDTNLSGSSLIEADAAGSDFLLPNDPSHLDRILSLDSMAKYRGVSVDSIYLGRKSMRREMMKLHDFIRANESIFMSMKLVASFDKGLFTYITGDTSKLTSIIDPHAILDTSASGVHITERPPNRIHYDTISHAMAPYFEDVDSTFFDVTLHKIKDIAIDSEFVLCVFNRRTNSLIRQSGQLKFLATADFDIYAGSDLTKKYSQGGTREITVPLHFVKGTGIHVEKYALKVEELTGGDATIPRLNATLCPNCPLTATYLPGEAKFFHVTVKPTGVPVAKGALEFNNQHKLVCAPKLLGYNTTFQYPVYDSNTVRYHLVYHSVDTVMRGLTSLILSRVHYRRSKELKRCSAEDVLSSTGIMSPSIWEVDRVLSDTIVEGSDSTFVNSDCRYPSIVVRFDTVDQQEYVYVVYNCQTRIIASPTLRSFIIAESQFAIPSVIPNSYVVSHYSSGGSLDLFGHPVVNAARGVNYYTYSDDTKGIALRARRPSFAGRSDSIFSYVRWFEPGLSSYKNLAEARHPSLNLYSRLSDDTTAALVWQERKHYNDTIPYDSAYDGWQIYYTELKTNFGSGTMMHYLPKLDSNNTLDWTYNYDSSILRPKYCGGSGCNGDWRDRQMPIVLRSPVERDTNRYHLTKILCHASRSNRCGGTDPITGVLYFSLCTKNMCDTCSKEYFSPIGNNATYSCTDSIRNVSGVIAESHDYWTGDSSFVYNIEFAGDNSILQVVQEFGQFGPAPADCFVENCVSPQLSGFPFVNGNSQWNYLRRYSHTATSPVNRDINNGVQYLMKGTTNQPRVTYTLQGYQVGERAFLLSDVTEPNSNSSFRKKEVKSNLRGQDTMSTSTFRVRDAKLVSFLGSGSATELASLGVRNERTGGVSNIALRQLFKKNQAMPEPAQLVLRNGGNDDYSLILTSNNPAVQYAEEQYVGSASSSLGKSSSSDEIESYTVDLSETWSFADHSRIQVYPNPSDDVVYIAVAPQERQYAYGGEKMSLVLTDVMGAELMRSLTAGGETIKYDLTSLPVGVYNVQLISNSHDSIGSSQVCTKRFVVQR